MKARIVLAGVLAAAVAAVAAPSAALAGPNDNNDARVAGVSPSGRPGLCDVGNFCIYTGPNYTGKVFQLYHCRSYSLSNWNGIGSWFNNNSGGAHAYILDRKGNTLVDSGPNIGQNFYDDSYNFKPAWFVKAC